MGWESRKEYEDMGYGIWRGSWYLLGGARLLLTSASWMLAFRGLASEDVCLIAEL